MRPTIRGSTRWASRLRTQQVVRRDSPFEAPGATRALRPATRDGCPVTTVPKEALGSCGPRPAHAFLPCRSPAVLTCPRTTKSGGGSCRYARSELAERARLSSNQLKRSISPSASGYPSVDLAITNLVRGRCVRRTTRLEHGHHVRPSSDRCSIGRAPTKIGVEPDAKRSPVAVGHGLEGCADDGIHGGSISRSRRGVAGACPSRYLGCAGRGGADDFELLWNAGLTLVVHRL
jgi:hypothetical protein